MPKRAWIILLCGVAVALLLAAPQLTSAFPVTDPVGQTAPRAGSAAQADRQNPYSDAWLAQYHGMFDNAWTAEYETRLQQQAAQSPLAPLFKALSPFYGPDVRMSNAAFAGSQNEFQIDISPLNSQLAIGTSNDGRTAGVGIYRTTDGGLTWTAQDASAFGVPAACCDPAVAFASNGDVYVGILDTSPAGQVTLKSTDGGVTFSTLPFLSLPDRNNIATDPSNPNIVYVTYSDLPTTNRIKGYKTTDGGATWGPSFFIGDAAPANGYQQSSQPQVASNGWVYVGYQEYENSGIGCSAPVRNEVSRSTDGGVTWTQVALTITQGGACTGTQAGRGIFCIAANNSSFRSRSHPILGISPTNPSQVYMVYSGGDLETAYTCGTATGFHSDTLFRRSTDAGATWSAPLKINTDPSGKDQYYPWIDVASNGTIWVGWNDRRNDPNNYTSYWYQAFSTDGGLTWQGETQVADVATQPSTFIGDYHGIAAKNDRVLGMWYDSRNTASGDPYTDPHVPAQGTPTPTITGTPPTATRTSTVTVTRTSTPLGGSPTATPCAGGTIVVQGAIDANDPTQTGRLFRDGIADTCAAPGTCGAPIAGSFRYDLYTYTNSSGSPVCVNVNVNTPCVGTNFIYSGAYLGSFNPANICQNWVADLGSSPNGTPLDYSFTVPAGATFVINVHEVTANAGCTSYTLTITGLPAGGCPTPSATPVPPTSTATNTPAPPTVTPVPPTVTPPAVTATSTPCTIQFTDVDQNNPFYSFIRCLACRQIVSGYSDGTFRWGNDVTRGQLSKIIAGAANLQTAIPSSQQTFEDVPNSNVFWLFIERLAGIGAISGYNCGGPGEPCGPGNRPYFRWGNNATRGQISKITAVTAGWNGPIPTTQQTFEDVPPSNAFWVWIEELASRNIISGYNCGGPGEPCGPGNRPYFRWGNNATRGQMSKIAAESFFPGCVTPAYR